ncbi:MAG: polymorphic toxin-type HINT domain-containing protein [Pirellula sp.]
MSVRNEFGLSEFVEGTLIYPIWSVDRNDWVSISDLERGERLQGAEGILYVESIDLVRRHVSVYNIEVHGEHVYQVGDLGLLVHNTCQLPILNPGFTPLPGIGTKAILPFEKMMRPVAGAWPAVMKNGDVYVHYMHVAANQVANGGMVGAVARSGWAWLDDMGNVVKVMWQ